MLTATRDVFTLAMLKGEITGKREPSEKVHLLIEITIAHNQTSASSLVSDAAKAVIRIIKA